MSAEHEVGSEHEEGSDSFRLLVESVQDYAIFLLDPTGIIRSWNAGAQRLKGYTAKEAIGRHFSIFYPPQEVRRGKPEYELRVAAVEGRWEEEGWRVRKDGTLFWANVVITALYNNAGGVLGYAKVTRDLTERRQADLERLQLLTLERTARAEAEAAVEQLQAMQGLIETALLHLDSATLLSELLKRLSELMLVDTAAILLLDNQQGVEVLVRRSALGLEEDVPSPPIPLGNGFTGRIASERQPFTTDRAYAIEQNSDIRPLFEEKGIRSLLGVPILMEHRLLGVLRVGSLHLRRFTPAEIQFLQIISGRVALAVEHARLLEAERRARQEIEVAAVMLQQRDEFLSIAAHELKTPMTSLRLGTQLILRQLTTLDLPELRPLTRATSTMEVQLEKLTHLVNELLDTMRFQVSSLALDSTICDLTALISMSVEETQHRAPHHTISMTSPGPLWTSIDPIRVEQVLINLLDNAVKYSPNGGSIEVELTQPTAETLRIAVRDHGIGIPLANRGRLFERFYQAHPDSHRSGMGLGLYICREIVQRHGGAIAVEFPADGGTRFVVTLPTSPKYQQPSEQREDVV